MTRSPATIRRLLAVLALAAGALLGSGCGTHAARPIGQSELDHARQFPYFRVYWVGRSFQGIPVTAADGREGYQRGQGTSIYYGDCRPGKSILGTGGCTLPLEITTVIYKLHRNAPLGVQHNIVVRGVPATVYDGGRSIEIYTGRVAVDLFGDTPERVLAAAQALRPLNTNGSANTLLPKPPYRPKLAGDGAGDVLLRTLGPAPPSTGTLGASAQP